MSLPKPERLSKTRDLEKVFRRSKRREGEFIIMRLHKKSAPPGRAAVIISKAVSKKAVFRTLLRRRILEWLRVKARIGLWAADCVVSAKPAAVKAPRQALYHDLAKTARELGLTS